MLRVGARGYVVEKRVAVGFGSLASVSGADGVLAWPERMAHDCLLCSLLLGSSLYSAVWLPRWISCLSAVGGPVRRAGLRRYDGRYEEVTDSLMEVSGQSLGGGGVAARACGGRPSQARPAFVPKPGGAHLLLPVDASRPERWGGYGCFLYGRGDTEVAAACRGWFHGGGRGHRACQAQLVGVPSGTVRSERHGGGDDGRGRRPAVALRRLRVGGPGGDGLGAP